MDFVMSNQKKVALTTLQEWLSFRNILSDKNAYKISIFKKTEKQERLIYHLGRQFSK